MHIAEGVLSGPVLAAGAIAAGSGVAVGLRRLQNEDIPRAALLSSVFFVASLLHVPVGPGSVHLMMHGLVGLVLGWVAFPVILVGLILQLQLFGFGGVTVLGVNTVVMAAPAVACHYLFRHLLRNPLFGRVEVAAFVAAMTAVMLSAVLLTVALVCSGREFAVLCGVIAASHVPLLLIEGTVTAFAVGFLHRVCPRLLHSPLFGRAPQQAV